MASQDESQVFGDDDAKLLKKTIYTNKTKNLLVETWIWRHALAHKNGENKMKKPL